MGNDDGNLLARLNALKPSQVSFETAKKPHLVDVGSARSVSIEDTLADRLRSLRCGSFQSGSVRAVGFEQTPVEALTSKVRDEVATEADPIRDWQQNTGDDPSFDEMLAELADDSVEWKLDPEDPKNIHALLQEAKNALPERNESALVETTDGIVEVNNVDEASEHEKEEQHSDAQDEADADEYVKKILAELDMDEKYGETLNGADTAQDSSATTAGEEPPGLDLPSTPSNAPKLPPSYEDSELAARFYKLGLDLPSTPSTAPSSKAKAAAKAKATSNLPTYTDEDMDSWCCICNEDGEVRCLGCDGDIYCQPCWREGHGNGPGQERGHKAVQYTRRGATGLAAA